ncbi:MAG TPA: hypothetical protein ENN80_03580, partial [Candidatus Hydrogenedentes bacterium]|nr:hypothetical protein [Candidatus Hydrogenedentota bacterium]
MREPSKIDLWFESMVMWATTGRICEDAYFTMRHYCLRILAWFHCGWLPYIREAEKELKPYDKQLHPEYTAIEKAGMGWLLPLIMFLIPLILSLAIGALIRFPLVVPATSIADHDPMSTFTNYLAIMAGVLATFTGLLLAVIALTVQVKTANLAGADFLIDALIRRRGFLPIAAFLSGTVCTALVGVILSRRLPTETLNTYTCVVAGLSFFSLLTLVDLLRRTMQTLGASELDELLSSELILLLRRSFRSTLRQALIQKAFSESLETMGFARHATNQVPEGHPTGYWLKRTGTIVAIDPVPLARIA